MDQSKACSRCTRQLPLTAFHRDHTTPTGVRAACKDCLRERKGEILGRPVARQVLARTDENGRTCLQCQEHKPLTDFYRLQRGGPYASQCKACILARMKATRESRGLMRAPNRERTELGKVCPRCESFRLWDAFAKQASGRADGHATYCRACARLVDREAKTRNAAEIKRRTAERYARPVDLAEVKRCPRCTQEKPKADFYANGKGGYCRSCRNEYARRRNQSRAALRREEIYGLTVEQYEQLLVKQGGRCAICQTEQGTGRDSLHVDHDHAHGPVRGLLCKRCNVGLGLFRDNAVSLQRAIEYLGRPPAIG